jgi:Protein of unknown function (DUF2855)
MSAFLVKRDDLRESRIVASEPLQPAPGQAVLRVEKFGLTANNITYAVFGEAMSYWNFFPAEAGWGSVPMWGFAEVEQSAADGLEPGARVYGYLPAASQLLVKPVAVSADGFIDGAAHRAELPAAYQSYTRTDTDPFYRSDSEELQMVLRPLFFTSFLIDDQLSEDGLIERGAIVISSASSKTAIGLAFQLAQREGVEVIGLTSPRSAAFVEGLEIYDRVVTYQDIDALERAPASFVDIAGDADVRAAVHNHYRDQLLYSMAVGVTHWEDFGDGKARLPGPRTLFFFAPERVGKRAKEWGGAGLQSRLADAWHPFCAWAGGWLEIVGGEGFEAVQSTYLEVLDGRVEPTLAHVLSLARP